ncbi:hypothetical protein ACP70R_009469 [Stipagrostis hirtigluma subsp. patula]
MTVLFAGIRLNHRRGIAGPHVDLAGGGRVRVRHAGVLRGGAPRPAGVPGVGDRRKCWLMGILAIVAEGITSEELNGDGAEPSLATIHWPHSPLMKARTCSTKHGNEATVSWLVSPRDEGGVDLLDNEIFLPRCSLRMRSGPTAPGC